MNWGKLLLPRWGSFGEKSKDAGNSLRLEKRRGQRVQLRMPVFVYGRAKGEPFSEAAETTNVSAHGGLVEMSTELARSKTLLITNLRTNEDLACRVARLGRTESGKTLVGVEFLRPAPYFWSIEFSSRG
jgi:hypothetical protein